MQLLGYRIDRMRLKIKVGTASAMVLYLTGLLYLASPAWVLDNITYVRAIGWVLAIAVATYLVIGDVHNWLDQKWFVERNKVDDFIREKLTTPCRDALCSRAVKLGIVEKEKDSLLSLFYVFIPADDTERERAFSYFGDYFITVNLSALSILGAITAILLASVTGLPRWDQRVLLPVISVLFPVLFTFLRYRTRRKLKRPAEAQTTRILASDLSRLKELLPSYRIYEGDKLCKDSGRCPLLPRN